VSPTSGDVAMYTQAVDLAAVVAAGDATPGPILPATTRIGHIHLNVSRLDSAGEFYVNTLGFSIRERDFPGALFLGRDGYHHHVGVNTWQSDRAAVPGVVGLVQFTIHFPGKREQQRVVDAARAAGHEVTVAGNATIVPDPDGIGIRLSTD
jgi:catechol 2,3-dioxygenase